MNQQVMEAYQFDSHQDILEQLLALNLEIADKEN